MASIPFTASSLYVGDLHPDVTEGILYEIFISVGPITSIRVCRDAVTRRSLGYAYVNFQNIKDATNALDQLNGIMVKGKPCRVMWCQRDPNLRKSGKGNIFIKNLSKDIDNKTLFDTFSKFGNILSCKIELDENNQSKGYGYIQYSTAEEADLAVSKVNGMMIADKQVFVGPFVPKKERQTSTESSFTNVFIKNLPDDFQDHDLIQLFAPYGAIKSATVMKDEVGKTKSFGFINFEDPAGAQQAVEELNNSEVRGKQIFVGRAQKKTERETELKNKFEQQQLQKYQGVNLYIKNIDDSIDDEGLLKLFSPFGTITSAKLMRDAKGNSKGFGFVCYSASDEASKAVQEMNGKIVGYKPLYVGLAQRKEERRAQLVATFSQMNKVPEGFPRMVPPIYPTGAPVFIQPGQPFVYPSMIPRGRFPPMQAMPPNYMMIPGRGMKGGRGGMPNPARRGMPKQAMGPVAMVPQPTGEAPSSWNEGQNSQQGLEGWNQAESTQNAGQSNGELWNSQGSEEKGSEEKKMEFGEKLYNLIEKDQAEYAGKITGMILDSCSLEEIEQLVVESDSLKAKVEEALNVLAEHGLVKEPITV